MVFESALDILVPKAEGLVGPFRDKYDPSAAEGMPAHITINYPFLALEGERQMVIDELESIFSNLASFTFSLTEVRRFPNVLYLTPAPDQPFKDLIKVIADRFPESPPYGGVFEEVIPHLTVAHVEDVERLNGIEEEIMRASRDQLPIDASAEEVWLVDNREGMWRRRVSFTLRGSP